MEKAGEYFVFICVQGVGMQDARCKIQDAKWEVAATRSLIRFSIFDAIHDQKSATILAEGGGHRLSTPPFKRKINFRRIFYSQLLERQFFMVLVETLSSSNMSQILLHRDEVR
jgi:hypothetical protein